MKAMQVAQTILEQLGGHRFRIMTGAKNFIESPDGLSFSIPGSGFAKNGINIIRIVLTPADTYKITFIRMRKHVATAVSEHADVYFDSLQEVFTRETGLETCLERRGSNTFGRNGGGFGCTVDATFQTLRDHEAQ